MKWVYCYIIVSFQLLISQHVSAQIPTGVNWHLVKEGNGIQVYTAPASVSGLKYIRVTATLSGTLDKVNKIFRDIPDQKDWVYSTRQSYLIQKGDDNHILYYNETSLPWPLSNRDIAINMKMEEDPNQQTLTITQEGVPNAVQVHKGIVRVPRLEGYWLFQNNGRGLLHTTYYLYVEPGGSLPHWVVNMFVTKGPYETFIKFKQLLSGQ